MANLFDDSTLDPVDVKAAIDKQTRSENFQNAQLSPEQNLNRLGADTFGEAGQEVGQLLGAPKVDPRLARADEYHKMVQDASAAPGALNEDGSANPEVLLGQLSGGLAKAGMGTEAANVAANLDAYRANMAKRRLASAVIKPADALAFAKEFGLTSDQMADLLDRQSYSGFKTQKGDLIAPAVDDNGKQIMSEKDPTQPQMAIYGRDGSVKPWNPSGTQVAVNVDNRQPLDKMKMYQEQTDHLMKVTQQERQQLKVAREIESRTNSWGATDAEGKPVKQSLLEAAGTNAAAAKALKEKLVMLYHPGDNEISRGEREAAGISDALWDRFKLAASTAITGKIPEDQLRMIAQVTDNIRTLAARTATQQLDTLRETAKSAGMSNADFRGIARPLADALPPSMQYRFPMDDVAAPPAPGGTPAPMTPAPAGGGPAVQGPPGSMGGQPMLGPQAFNAAAGQMSQPGAPAPGQVPAQAQPGDAMPGSAVGNPTQPRMSFEQAMARARANGSQPPAGQTLPGDNNSRARNAELAATAIEQSPTWHDHFEQHAAELQDLITDPSTPADMKPQLKHAMAAMEIEWQHIKNGGEPMSEGGKQIKQTGEAKKAGHVIVPAMLDARAAALGLKGGTVEARRAAAIKSFKETHPDWVLE